MPLGHLTDEMLDILRPIVEGLEVWDLGSGDEGHARTLLGLGASRVFCVDKEPMVRDCTGITPVHAWFGDISPDMSIPVAFVSWPPNRSLPHLNRLLGQAKIVIYLGSNTDGRACGDVRMFVSLAGRSLLAHVPYYRNSLLVYGEPLGRGAPLTGEEYAVFSGQLMRFDEAQKLGR